MSHATFETGGIVGTPMIDRMANDHVAADRPSATPSHIDVEQERPLREDPTYRRALAKVAKKARDAAFSAAFPDARERYMGGLPFGD